MSKKLIRRIAICIVLFSLMVILVFQFAWGSDGRFLPGTTVLGLDVAAKTPEEIRSDVDSLLTDREIIIETTDGVIITKMPAVVADQVVTDTLIRATEYTLLQRLIPGSVFWIGRALSVNKFDVELDVSAIITKIPRESSEGYVAVGDNITNMVEPKIGFVFDDMTLRDKLTHAQVGAENEHIIISATVNQPKISLEQLQTKAAELEDARAAAEEAFKGKSLALFTIGTDGYWDMGLDPDYVYTSASTYKLFIAYTMARKVEAGEWSWNDRLNGRSLESCLEIMIVDSNNECPEAWLIRLGFSHVNAMVHEISGLSNTQIANGNMQTSPRDLGAFLLQLYRGKLMNTENTEKLINLMKRQKYRDGIPTGVAPNKVADKVGFLFGLLHDAAIVYSEQGDYILVIMTDGSSWENIAKIAAAIAPATSALK